MMWEHNGEPMEMCEEFSSVRRFLAREFPATVGLSFGIGVIVTAALNPFGGQGPAEWMWSLLFTVMISVGIGAALSIAYYFVFHAMVRRGVPRWLSHILVTATAVAAGVEVAVQAIEWLGGPAAQFVRPSALRIGFAIGAVAVAGHVAYYQLRYKGRKDELRAEQAQQEALRAQLRALQARANPHFLFNSLNTVAGLIDEEPGKAERMLEQLSSLYRYSLKGSTAEWVRLDEELTAIRGYLEVEGVRLGTRLHASLEVEPGAEVVLVPPLLLQPLVENAVHHGISDRKEGGRLDVRIARNGAGVVMTVADDGPGPGNSQRRGTGTSLSDLRQRLKLIYGERASLEVGGAAEGGYRVEIRIPVESAP